MKPVEATLVILLFSSVDSFAGQAPPPSVLRVYSSLGYSQASFDEVKEYYVSIAPLWDISIAPRWFHAEFDMGRMYMIGVGVSVSRFKLLEAGFSVGYSYSRATGSMYNPAGTLYLDGSVNTFIVSVPVQINLVDLWDATVYTRVEPNLTYTSLSLPGRFRDAQTPPSWYNTELSFAGLCLGAQGSLGLRIPVGSFFTSIEAALRFARATGDEGSFETNASPLFRARHETLGWTLDQSGIVYLWVFGLRL